MSFSSYRLNNRQDSTQDCDREAGRLQTGSVQIPDSRRVWIRDRVRSAGSTVLELLFPGTCLLCGQSLLLRSRPFYPVCESCLKTLQPIGDPRCRVCGCSLVSERNLCTRCRKRNYHFTTHRSLFEYRGSVRELLYQLKFQGRKRVALVLAALLAETLKESYQGLPVVPVPARRGRIRQRGWDHMQLISRYISKGHGVRIYRCLDRKGGVPQKALNFEQRLRNIASSEVSFVRTAAPSPSVSEVVLIDDIFTTGATVDECSRILRMGGMQEVHVLTVAQD